MTGGGHSAAPLLEGETVSYCDVPDVQALLPTWDFSTGTPCSEEVVQAYIINCDATLRSNLDSGGYLQDQTDAVAIQLLKGNCAMGAAAMVLRGMHGLETAAADSFQKIFDAFCTQLHDGVAGVLTSVAQGLRPRSRYLSSPSTYPGPVFRRGEEQW